MDIVEFLRARLDEDEAQAKHAIAGDIDYLPSITCKCGRPTYIGGDANRVLREVEAKRRIVDGYGDDDCVRDLASVYADHPDYDPE